MYGGAVLVSAGAHRDQKRTFKPLELELQEAVWEPDSRL